MAWRIDEVKDEVELRALRSALENRKEADALLGALAPGGARFFGRLALRIPSTRVWRELFAENEPFFTDSERTVALAHGARIASFKRDQALRRELTGETLLRVAALAKDHQLDVYLQLFCADCYDGDITSEWADRLAVDVNPFRKAVRAYHEALVHFFLRSYERAASSLLDCLALNASSLENSSLLRSSALEFLALTSLRTWPTWKEVFDEELPRVTNDRLTHSARGVYSILALVETLNGSFEKAYAFCRKAEMLADEYSVLAPSVARCWVAMHAGDRRFAAADIDSLKGALLDADPKRTFSLVDHTLLAAEVYATLDAQVALTLLEHAKIARSALPAGFLFRDDAAFAAGYNTVKAAAYETMGQRSQALESASAAIEAGADAVRWRAIQACLIANRVSGKQDWLKMADDMLIRYPSRLLRAETERLQSAEESSLSQLTARQRSILALIERGRRATEIASELHLSSNTVRTHMKVIYRAFGVRSNPELLAILLSKGRRAKSDERR
jgi:DNA-binding CsgD family transcriptional regulator